jgi:hydroxymethylbilane synthase
MTADLAPLGRALVAGTRSSRLARIQTDEFIQLLLRACPQQTTVVESISTRGDRDRTAPLSVIGGQGVFAKELEQALLDGRIDVAIHSLKDLPPVLAPGLVIAAIPARNDPRDALVSRQGRTLTDLAPGARIGTSSARRRALILRARRDCIVEEVRGNVPTRVEQARSGSLDAVVLAAAGLARLGLLAEATELFPTDVMLPAPGQGALAVEARADDLRVLELVTALDDPPSRAAASAERAFLAQLGAGCTLPVAALAQTHDATIVIKGAILSWDGSMSFERSLGGPIAEAETIGAQLAVQLREMGGDRLAGEA